jgi:hypothetical protein
MPARFRLPRKPADLGLPLNKKLSVYALAAGAAGVSALALAPAADAKIIYTKTNTPSLVNQPYNLDVNHDGTTDFSILYGASNSGTRKFHIKRAGVAVKGWQLAKGVYNSVVAAQPIRFRSAADLPPNVPVWKKRNFGSDEHMASCEFDVSTLHSSTQSRGPWRNVQSRYLGLKFFISGQTHYGWARLNVKLDKECNFTVTLTGYAYETIPNKLILTGHTKGPSGEIVPASLGHLAGGASAISDWRVKRIAAPAR